MKMYTKTCMDAGGLHQDAQETIFIDTLTSEGGATLLRSRYCTPFPESPYSLTKETVSPEVIN